MHSSTLRHLKARRYSVLTIGTLLTMAFTVYPKQVNAKEAIRSTPINVYPKEIVQIFVDSCVSGGQGADSAMMKKICSCSIAGIQNQYTLTEFIKVSDELSANKPMSPELTQIIESCTEQAVK